MRRVPAAITFGGEDAMTAITTVSERRTGAADRLREAVSESRLAGHTSFEAALLLC